MSHPAGPQFGIATAPQQVAYHDVLRVWREADAIPQIEHAWLFDHLVPIGGDPNGPIFEGWTLLSALAAQTGRLRLGLLVPSNRIRRCWPRSPRPSTSSPAGGSTSASARARGPTSRGRVVSTTPTACRTTTPATQWGASRKRAR